MNWNGSGSGLGATPQYLHEEVEENHKSTMASFRAEIRTCILLNTKHGYAVRTVTFGEL